MIERECLTLFTAHDRCTRHHQLQHDSPWVTARVTLCDLHLSIIDHLTLLGVESEIFNDRCAMALFRLAHYRITLTTVALFMSMVCIFFVYVVYTIKTAFIYRNMKQ